MGHRFMSTTWAMDVSSVVSITVMVRSADRWIGGTHGDFMLVNMVSMRVVQMAIMEIVDMAIMYHARVFAVGPMGVVVIRVVIAVHRISSEFRLCVGRVLMRGQAAG